MKRVPKIVATAGMTIILVMFAFIGTVEIITTRSQREVTRVVDAIAQGTALADLTTRLGAPNQLVTNDDLVSRWNSRGDKATTTNCHLYMYATHSIPYRWILLFVDKDSDKVIHAEWTDM